MKNLLTKIFLILLLNLASAYCFSQSDINNRIGLNYGIHIGWHWAGKNEALQYSTKSESTISIQNVLTNSINYTQLKDFYNDDFSIYELPSNIQYKSTLSIGGTLQYYLTENFAIYLNAIYVNPTITNSNFSIKLASISSSVSDVNLEQGSVSAKESRLNFDLGIHKSFSCNKAFKPYLELAMACSFLEMKNYELSIGNLTSSLMYSTTSSNYKASYFGYGASCSAGIQLPILNKFYMYCGISLSTLHYGIINDKFSLSKGLDIKILL